MIVEKPDEPSLGQCDHCEKAAVFAVNTYKGCADHVDETVREAVAPVRRFLSNMKGADE